MYRKWKNAAALGLAVLLGCMMPVCTMLAAEDEAGSVSESGVSYEEEAASAGVNAPDDGTVSADEEEAGDGTAPAGESVAADEDEAVTDGANAPDDGTTSEAEAEPVMETWEAADSESADAPGIVITRDGKDSTCSLGGQITFEYVNNWGPQVEVSVSQGDQDISIFWAKDKVTDMEAGAKTEEQMDSLTWYRKEPSESILLSQDGGYVIYAKVVSGEQKYYARSNGIVVDTRKPVIKGVEDGKTYPEGTLFQVEDVNLDCVLVNEQPAAAESGNYQVVANGSSCVIRAKDKAGNETVCSITVSENEKPGTGTVISESGDYALKAGVKYHLAEGKWKVDGDKSVYQGGCDFYVRVDGSYKFTK